MTNRLAAMAGIGFAFVAAGVAPASLAAPAPSVPPTITLDQGLHVSVGSVLGSDADAYGYSEAGGLAYFGIHVPVYAKWHQSGITTEDRQLQSCNQADGCIECCSPTWHFNDVRTTYNFFTYEHKQNSGSSELTAGASDVLVEGSSADGTTARDFLYYYTDVTQDGAATYSPGWTTGSGKIWSGGGVHKSSKAGQTASFTATANQFALVTDHGPGRGTADVYLDGKKFASIHDDGISVNRVVDAQIYTVTKATHTIKVVVTKGRIDIDAFLTSYRLQQ
jgi:hypothetical protein